MPAWQAESFIVRTLESLAAQTYSNLRVLISDDASTDGTTAICERFAANHARFRFVRQTERQGWIGNVNALLRAAKGDYLFFAFHDDPVGRTYVTRLVEALSGPGAVLAFSDVQLDRSAVGMAGAARSTRIWMASRTESSVRVARPTGRTVVDSKPRIVPRWGRDAHRRTPAACSGRVWPTGHGFSILRCWAVRARSRATRSRSLAGRRSLSFVAGNGLAEDSGHAFLHARSAPSPLAACRGGEDPIGTPQLLGEAALVAISWNICKVFDRLASGPELSDILAFAARSGIHGPVGRPLTMCKSGLTGKAP